MIKKSQCDDLTNHITGALPHINLNKLAFIAYVMEKFERRTNCCDTLQEQNGGTIINTDNREKAALEIVKDYLFKIVRLMRGY